MAEYQSTRVSWRESFQPSLPSPRLSNTAQQKQRKEEEGAVTTADTEKTTAPDEHIHASLVAQPPSLPPLYSLGLTFPRSISCPLPDSPAHLHTIIAHRQCGPSRKLMSQYTYGSIPTSEEEAANIVQHPQQEGQEHHVEEEGCVSVARHQIGEIIESRRVHMVILALTILDILLVILQIGASLLHLDETEEEAWFIALFEHLSLAIVSFFVLEILLKFFAFGPRYFWKGTRHGVLHLIDAVIILVSFFLEVFLKSTAAKELSSLLIIFRLWRIIKLTGTVAIEVNEHDDIKVKKLEQRVHQLEKELAESQAQVARLRQFTEDQV